MAPTGGIPEQTPIYLRRKSVQLPELGPLPSYALQQVLTTDPGPLREGVKVMPLSAGVVGSFSLMELERGSSQMSLPTPGLTPDKAGDGGANGEATTTLPSLQINTEVERHSSFASSTSIDVTEDVSEPQFKTWPRRQRPMDLIERGKELQKELEQVQARAAALKQHLQNTHQLELEIQNKERQDWMTQLERIKATLLSTNLPDIPNGLKNGGLEELKITLPTGEEGQQDPQLVVSPSLTMYPVHELARLATYLVFHLWHGYPLPDLQLPVVTHFLGEEVLGNLKRGRSQEGEQVLTSSLTPDSPGCNPGIQQDMIRFLQYVTHMLHTTRLPSAMVGISLLYIHRLRQLNPNLVVHRGSEFRAWTTSCMLSNKVLDDNRFTNKTWSVVSGIPLKELNVMELEFMKGLEWSLEVKIKVWQGWLQHLEQSGLWAKIVREMRGMSYNMSDTQKISVTNLGLGQVLSCMSRGITREENEKGLWWHKTTRKEPNYPKRKPVNLSLKGQIPPVPDLIPSIQPSSVGTSQPVQGISYQFPVSRGGTPIRNTPSGMTPGNVSGGDYFALPIRDHLRTMIPTSSHGEEMVLEAESGNVGGFAFPVRLGPPLPTPPWEYPAPRVEVVETVVGEALPSEIEKRSEIERSEGLERSEAIEKGEVDHTEINLIVNVETGRVKMDES